jgi:hydrogenase-4 component F
MEHMGLIAVGAAIGSRLAIAAVLLHMAGHGLAKTVAFLSSGQILNRVGSTEILSVRGLAVRAPLLAATFGLAVVALLGFPPAALFASELGIARAGAIAGLGWAIAVAFLLALLAFAAIATRTGRMLLGPPPEPAQSAARPNRLSFAAAAPLVAGLLAVAALGITTEPFTELLSSAAAIVGAP